MFKNCISKEKLSQLLKNSRILRPLANSRDLLIPAGPFLKFGARLFRRLRLLGSIKTGIGTFLRTLYRDARANKLNFLNRGLVLASSLLFFLLILEFTKAKPHPNLLLSEENRKRETKAAPGQQPKPVVYYSREIGKKELFTPDQGFGTTLASKESENSNIRLAKLAENLALLGVTLDHDPSAVIEDQKDKKTYFLKVGEFIGQIKVEAILQGKVILSYEDERLELVL